MNTENNSVEDLLSFKNVIQDIAKAEISKAGFPTYKAAIVQKVNEDGSVDVYLPPNKDNLVTNVLNKCGEVLYAGDSVEIATKNGSLTNCWVQLKHSTNVPGTYGEVQELSNQVVLKVSGGRLSTTQLLRPAELGNSFTIIADDINLDGYNIVLNGKRGITIDSPYFKVNTQGRITSTSGLIGGWEIGATKLYSGSGANYVALDSGTNEENYAIWLGAESSSDAPFRVTRAGAVSASNITITGGSLTIGNNFSVSNAGVLNATSANLTSATVSGNITASSGKIAGYTISGDTLYGSQVGMDAESGGHYAFWAGADVNNTGSAPFRVGHDGSLYASSATIVGDITANSGTFNGTVNANAGTIGGCSISNGILQIANANITELNVSKITGGTNSNNLTFNGSVTCNTLYASNSGTIGGFTIGSTQLSGATGKGSMMIRRGSNASIDFPCNGGRLMLASNANNGVSFTSAKNIFIGDDYDRVSPEDSNSSIEVRSYNGNLRIAAGNNTHTNRALYLSGQAGVYAASGTVAQGLVVTSQGQASSENVKENIIKFNKKEYDSAINLLRNMDIYNYDYKYGFYGNRKHQYGFIIDRIQQNKGYEKFFDFYEEKAYLENGTLDFIPRENDENFEYMMIKKYDPDVLDKYILVCLKAMQNKIDELENKLSQILV